MTTAEAESADGESAFGTLCVRCGEYDAGPYPFEALCGVMLLCGVLLSQGSRCLFMGCAGVAVRPVDTSCPAGLLQTMMRIINTDILRGTGVMTINGAQNALERRKPFTAGKACPIRLLL